MSSFNFAYTVPFPKSSYITLEQVFVAIRVKCRDPTNFIEAFTSSEVLEETANSIKRRVTTSSGHILLEDIDLYAPTMAVSKSKQEGSIITNVVSEAETGGFLLTFTFDLADVAWYAEGREDAMDKVKIATRKSMETIMAMFERGELN